jgi:hypothetical protein
MEKEKLQTVKTAPYIFNRNEAILVGSLPPPPN